jgi:hypothetical protein
MLVATAKTHFEEQALVAEHKTKKAGRLADKAVRPACFVLCRLIAPSFFEVDVLQINMS